MKNEQRLVSSLMPSSQL